MARKHIHSLILAGALALCYALTLAPGLTWANGGADGGDLITAAATNGVAHPGGYPLYLLLARAFQAIPAGTLAFRTNLLSAACTILAALALRALLQRQNIPAGASLAAALAFGLAPAVWSQAVISEVYGLQSLLLVLFLYGLLDENFPGGEWTRGLIFGLATGNHLTTLILLPLLLLRSCPAAPGAGRCAAGEPRLVSPGGFAKRVLACALGVSVYLLLSLHAYFHPPVNWGNPVTPEGLWWLVSGRLYAAYPFDVSPADAVLRLRACAGLLLEQFSLPGVLLGVYGLFSGLPRRTLLASLWVFAAFAGFAIAYGSYDSQVYLIPAYIAFAVWLAYGIQDILRGLSARSPRLAQFTAALIVIGLLVRIPFILPTVDASRDRRAEQFGAQFVASAPRSALIFAGGDEAVFALWYFHYALGQRQDVVVIADGLLVYPWYTETLAHTYPSLRISPAIGASRFEIIAHNPDRPVCYVSSGRAQFCGPNP